MGSVCQPSAVKPCELGSYMPVYILLSTSVTKKLSKTFETRVSLNVSAMGTARISSNEEVR